MNTHRISKLYDFAHLVTRTKNHVSVLKPELIEEYPPLAHLIEKNLKAADLAGTLLMPEFRYDGNQTVGVFSDYGGESGDSHYKTYSFLVIGWNHSFHFQDHITQVRDKHGFQKTTEMAYKNLRRGEFKRCLPDYLKACEFITGMLFTLAIHKDVDSVFGGTGKEHEKYLVSILSDYGFGVRKPKVAEKLLRIIHTSAYLTAWLSSQGQKIFWMGDNDSIVANQQLALKTIKLFQSILPIYSPHNFEMMSYATPGLMDDPGRMVDYLSVPDLAAGAVERYLTKKDTNALSTLTSEANNILAWLGLQSIGLKKHTMLIRRKDENNLESVELRFSADNIKNDSIGIPIVVKRGD